MTNAPERNNRKEAVQGVRNIYARNSQGNALDFFIRKMLDDNIATAIPVKVVGVQSGGSTSPVGYVDVLPLVCGVDAEGNTVENATIYHLPYFRLQGGIAAVVIDPIVGDTGQIVSCKSDASNVITGTKEPQQPGSFRVFDWADGFYYGGFLNKEPKVFIEIKQDETIVLTAKSGFTFNGDIQVNGSITSTGDQIAGGISQKNHTHGGVQSGGSTTSKPVGG